MKLQTSVMLISLWLICFGCESRKMNSLNDQKVNEILSSVDENDPGFVAKGISFDSILTLAGTRSLNDFSEPVKAKLYFYGDLVRGYYNLSNRDERNLQVFGKKVDEYWAIKCVTKLNMEEAGGYIILKSWRNGFWSNGHYNFEQGKISMSKQKIDYNDLQSW